MNLVTKKVVKETLVVLTKILISGIAYDLIIRPWRYKI